MMSDTTPIGKETFLKCYYKARVEALTEKIIKSGWLATSLWPRNMAKPLMSRLLLENTNKAKNTSGGQAITPFTDGMAEDSAVPWETPKRSADLKAQVLTLRNLKDTDNSTRRLLFNKIAKSFDNKDAIIANQELKIKALEADLDSSRKKKRRKVQTSPNSKFVNIRAIWWAQLEADDQEVESEESPDSSDSENVSDCIVVGELSD